jgi:hypothetical protein
MAGAVTVPDTPDYSNLGSLFASPWYLRVDDNLRITSYNALAGVVLEVRHRMVDREGAIQASQERQVPNTDRTAKATVFATAEGWLIGGEIFASGAAPLAGQTFVVVEIVRGLGSSALPLEAIAAGYVTAKKPLRFPALSLVDSLDGGGALRSVAGTSPGVGTEISETVPTGARWELLAFRAILATSAVVATRQPMLVVDDGATELAYCPVNSSTGASTANRYGWWRGTPNATGVINNRIAAGIPHDFRLMAGARIKTLTLAIDVGDQWSGVQYLVREFIEGA